MEPASRTTLDRHACTITRGDWDGSRWVVATRPLHTALRPYVRRMIGYEERAPGPRSQRQFPTASVVLIIEFGPTLRVARGGVDARHRGGFAAGLGDVFAMTHHDGQQQGVQVDLTPTGARRLFGVPASEIAGLVVAADDVLPRGSAPLSEQLADAPDWAARLDLIERRLARGILTTPLDTTRMDWAVARIEACGGNLDVGSLSRALGCSHKHLIALFREQVGVPPKLLARLVRFERLMSAVRRGGARPFAELALAHGYYDQAHLARDVRTFTGLTPTQARSELSALADLFG